MKKLTKREIEAIANKTVAKLRDAFELEANKLASTDPDRVGEDIQELTRLYNSMLFIIDSRLKGACKYQFMGSYNASKMEKQDVTNVLVSYYRSKMPQLPRPCEIEDEIYIMGAEQTEADDLITKLVKQYTNG